MEGNLSLLTILKVMLKLKHFCLSLDNFKYRKGANYITIKLAGFIMT